MRPNIRNARFPRHLQALSMVLAVLSLFAVGCEDDEGEDADVTDMTMTDTTTDTAVEDTTDDMVVVDEFRFVRINDLSTTGDTTNSGADVDAVILDKAAGERVYAIEVEGFQHGGGVAEGPDLNPSEALNAPDSFSVWEDSQEPVCDLDAGYVSLGGMGGYLIVEMGEPVEANDTLTVLEVGGCTGNADEPGIVEEVEVEVSTAADVDGQWTVVGQGSGPVVALTVPEL